MNDEDIDELIGKLVELKENKDEISFELDSDNEILIKYDKDIEDDIELDSEIDEEEEDDAC
jgi:hypothetical protein